MCNVFLFSLLLASIASAYPTNDAGLHEEAQREDPTAHWGQTRIPSVRESAIQARRILQLENIATLSTVFPSSANSDDRLPKVANKPFALTDYYAVCGLRPYDPTILGVTIANTMKNAAAGSNVTLSLRYHLPEDAPPNPDPWAYLPANLPRIALLGYLEKLSQSEVRAHDVRDCFVNTHPEAAIWEPGTDIHESWWGRIVVEEVYFFGGFGDRARIGWIPLDMWQGVTQKEIDSYRLVGESGYSEALTTSLDLEKAMHVQKPE